MLFTLFQNEIQGNEIECSLPFELISTSSYDITMTLPIYSADQIEISLSYDVNNVNTEEVICSKQLFGMEYITIFATSPNSSANEISFKCDNQNQKTIQFLNKDNIHICNLNISFRSLSVKCFCLRIVPCETTLPLCNRLFNIA